MLIIEKLNKDLIKANKKFKKANENAVKVYSGLSNQCMVAQSKPFADLLSAEVNAYTKLTLAANNYFKIQAKYTQKCNERNGRLIKSGAVVSLDDLQKIYALSNIIPIKNSIEIYVRSISRDCQDWKAINKAILELGIDIVIDNTPVVSDIKSIVDQIMQAINIITECTKDGIDYSDLDHELYKIEIHTTIMDNTEKLFLYQANVIKEAIAFLEQDPQEYYNEIIKEK